MAVEFVAPAPYLDSLGRPLLLGPWPFPRQSLVTAAAPPSAFQPIAAVLLAASWALAVRTGEHPLLEGTMPVAQARQQEEPPPWTWFLPAPPNRWPRSPPARIRLIGQLPASPSTPRSLPGQMEKF